MIRARAIVDHHFTTSRASLQTPFDFTHIEQYTAASPPLLLHWSRTHSIARTNTLLLKSPSGVPSPAQRDHHGHPQPVLKRFRHYQKLPICR